MLAASIALGRTGADEGVDLVDEQHDVAAGADLLEHLLQALLEVTAVARAGDQRAEVERVDLLVLERLGHVALDDVLGQALDDRRLADAGLADEDRVVLGTAGQDLHDPLDLLLPADDRVELAFAGVLGEVATELVEHQRRRRRVAAGAARRGPGGGRLLALEPDSSWMTCWRTRLRSAPSFCSTWAATPSPSRIRPSRMCSVPM